MNKERFTLTFSAEQVDSITKSYIAYLATHPGKVPTRTEFLRMAVLAALGLSAPEAP